MASILCLAHYCDTHGPTPLMVTEGLPVACSTCFINEDTPNTGRPGSPSGSGVISRSDSASFEKESSFATDISSYQISTSAINTPPESPRIAALQTRHANGHRRDSSFRKTYDEADRKRAIPCENCALTLPKKVSDNGSPSNTKEDPSGPILRTRKAYELISCSSSSTSSQKSSPSDSEDGDHDRSIRNKLRRHSLRRSVTSSTTSSISSQNSSNSNSHAHYLDYTSSHDPLTSPSFSLLRASCLRTLSCETLPPTRNISPTTPTSPYTSKFPTSASTSAPSSTTASGGPIFFGDSLAGYTTAYIFRIPDPHARGRRRVYAFICLSSTKERAAMRAFSYLAAAFRDLAAWIQGLAEAEAERLDGESNLSSPISTGGFSGPSSLLQSRGGGAGASPFLSGRGNWDRDGYASRGPGIRSRGLAELVGKADFFIELHVRFVALLAQLKYLMDGN